MTEDDARFIVTIARAIAEAQASLTTAARAFYPLAAEAAEIVERLDGITYDSEADTADDGVQGSGLPPEGSEEVRREEPLGASGPGEAVDRQEQHEDRAEEEGVRRREGHGDRDAREEARSSPEMLISLTERPPGLIDAWRRTRL